MKNKLLAANWKSNMTKDEAKAWFEEVSKSNIPNSLGIVIFPPFTFLDFLDFLIKANNLSFKLGAQDISPFDLGPYTGEVSAHQIKEFADYVLIGHSERRSNFNESNELVNKKIDKALLVDLIPIVCVSNLDQVRSLSPGNFIIAYEPIAAIGTGNPEDPKTVFSMVSQIKQIKNADVLYGGSVNENNIKEYLDIENISGALVGGASLDSKSFTNILKNAI